MEIGGKIIIILRIILLYNAQSIRTKRSITSIQVKLDHIIDRYLKLIILLQTRNSEPKLILNYLPRC